MEESHWLPLMLIILILMSAERRSVKGIGTETETEGVVAIGTANETEIGIRTGTEIVIAIVLEGQTITMINHEEGILNETGSTTIEMISTPNLDGTVKMNTVPRIAGTGTGTGTGAQSAIEIGNPGRTEIETEIEIGRRIETGIGKEEIGIGTGNEEAEIEGTGIEGTGIEETGTRTEKNLVERKHHHLVNPHRPHLRRQ